MVEPGWGLSHPSLKIPPYRCTSIWTWTTHVFFVFCCDCFLMDGSFFMIFICFYMFLLIYVHLLQGKPYLSLGITAELAALVRNPAALSWSPFRPTQGEVGKVSIPNGPKILNQYISIVNICACSIKPDPPSCCCPCCQLYCPAEADAKGTF